MSTSASAIMDGLISIIGSIDGVGAANVAKDYSVLDTTTSAYGFAVVVQFASLEMADETFDDSAGTNDTSRLIYYVEGFIKYLSDEAAFHANRARFADKLVTQLEAHRTLSDTCDTSILRRVEDMTTERDVDFNGSMFKWLRGTVEAVKYAD